METRISQADERHNRGFNCAQAVACTYADLVGVDEKTAFRATEGLGLGMGNMAGTCGALSGACVIAGFANSGGDLEAPTTKGATYKLSRKLVDRFEEMSGATRCRDLKGVDTGCVLCTCPQCIENACKALEEVVFKDEA